MTRIRQRNGKGRFVAKEYKTKRIRIDDDLYTVLTFFKEKAKAELNISVTESDIANIILENEFYSDTDDEGHFPVDKEEYFDMELKDRLIRESKKYVKEQE